MNDIVMQKTARTIGQFDMFGKSERLLVCLSGGADSVSLLLCLKMLGYDVCACHVNHQLRGEESERDQRFCEQLCEKLGVELYTYRIDVRDYCRENQVSVEEGARTLRYEIFSKIKADKICTAHTLSDCIETTLFNLARGTGLKGLCSIPPKRDNIVRPLINCTREEITDFLKEQGQDWVTDSTNLTDEYTRNRIRHNVVPQLEKINPSLMKSYEDTLSFLRKDMLFLERTAENAYEQCCADNVIDAEMLGGYDDCIRDRVLMRWLTDNGLPLSHDSIALVRDAAEKNGKVNIAKDTYVICRKGRLFAERETADKTDGFSPVNVEADGEYSFCGRKIAFNIVKMENADCDFANVHKKFANCCMDYDKIKGGLVLRRYGEGDRIHLVSRSEPYSIRKLLKNNFPLEKRKSAVILYDEDGAVFVEGSGVSERVKITCDTKRILVFRIDDFI